MPDAKYFDRPGKGVMKHTLGMDNEDMPMNIKRESATDKTMAMPTEKTADHCGMQDGGLKPWKPMGRK